MKIYIDFDDVICETAVHFTILAKELFGIELPYSQVQFFNLKKAFDLNDDQYDELMRAGHLPEVLMAYAETPKASQTINKWVDAGHEVFVITGRPFNSYEPSRRWLDEHGLQRIPLFCVDKYGRESFNQDCSYSMTLAQLYDMTFDFAVEDSPAAFEHVLHFEGCQVAVFDRPWNKNADFPKETFQRCSGWEEIDRMLEAYEKKRLSEQIQAVARECGNMILHADRTDIGIRDKAGKANFVTRYDCMVQSVAQERLTAILPEAEFLGEEDGASVDETKEYIFVVDPIDGTTNFIKDYHGSCISIGLIRNGKRFLGVVYNPYLDEMFYAVKGEGAYLNGKPIHVSGEDLSNGIVLFGSSPYNTELARASFDLAYDYFTKALDIRRSGSAAIDLCSVAAGRAELYFEMILSPWDFAAGALIVEEAGGVVTTLDGNEVPCLVKSSVLARNKDR